MNIQMNTASNTMGELQKKIDLIGNNIANVNTTGYKRQEASFSDALVQSIEKQVGPQNEVGRNTPFGLRIGAGAILSQTATRNEQGSIRQTDRPLDFMIQGESAYFRIASEDNTFFTKDGSFQVQPVPNSNQVSLVTANGDAVLAANNQPIVFDADYKDIQLNGNGTLEISYQDPTKQPTEIQLGIAQINRTDSLEKIGGNRFQLTGTEAEQLANGNLQFIDLSQQRDGTIGVKQGALEMSNVELADEMTELISTQRLFQSQGRAISYADDMMGLVNTIKG
ncbi:flagellar hook-basal body protein [Planococcus antarcticus DSM 14505]|uniref:Flagellar hook-basal body protein n=1 Tax=Planococcus antarcticus DSM 14505 TaxID=1185653 RepID=A0AA87IQ77_9BACL|nr:flagellar hook-basal body protein [Planococcus antarcticus]EIM08477.1 flagellar hook-basal body protein [Planococcus antarcticus DSM 14505]